MHVMGGAIVALGLAIAAACTPAGAAALYECVDAQGSRSVGYDPCESGTATVLDVDRASPTPPPEPAVRPLRSEPAPHRLTQAERERIVRLRRDERDASAQSRIASEVEIAAIREGADAKLDAADRAALEQLRPKLAATDAAVRDEALAQWEAIYARHREPPRPRVQATPPPFGSRPEASFGNPPASPLTRPVPGTQGPLVITPNAPPSGIARPPLVADPATGRVLAPAGNDRVVDPLTGTLWMRSGRIYVDPATGRVIPGP